MNLWWLSNSLSLLKVEKLTPIVFCVVTAFFVNIASSEVAAQTPRHKKGNGDRMIDRLSFRLKIDRDKATEMFRQINYFIDDLTLDLTYLASSRDDYSRKENRKDQAIASFFTSRESEVGVSSLKSNRIDVHSIEEYLSRLIGLTRYKYTKVELLFNTNYLDIGDFGPSVEEPGMFEFSTTIEQIFKAYNDDNLVYADKTYKSFRILLDPKTAKILAKEILVQETSALEYYKNRVNFRDQ